MRKALIIVSLCGAPAVAQDVTTPSEHLGRQVGMDFELADWDEVSSYYRLLAEQSPHVQTSQVGTSTEGRDFLLSVISSVDNLANLDTLRAHAAVLADPRGHDDERVAEAIRDGRVILLISPAMHSTETAGSQFGMVFSHLLATSDDEPWRSARENMVIGIFPTTNPDGLDHVTNWYRETVGTPYEASRLLKLYQYYTGHDNNRDWFALTQAETRIVTEQLYSVWRPQVYWDVHQQGSRRERMFVPPFRDPLNPNLDAAIISGIDALGSRALLDMTRDGLTGISTGVSYDMWWNGGNRNVPVRHNVIGLLTEAASVELATPVFLPRSRLAAPRGLDGYQPSNRFPDPWPGGWWRLSDIIDYQLAFGRSLVASLSREREVWLANAVETARRVITRGEDGAPVAWLIPSDNRDPDAVRRLAQILLWSGVEVHVSDEPLFADGREYPAGTIIVMRSQPYGSHVKDLFEVQRYPDGQPPYDVAGWTLPLVLGVRRIEVMAELESGDLRRVTDADDAVAAFGGDPRIEAGSNALTSRHSGDWSELLQRVDSGAPHSFIGTGDRAGLLMKGIVAQTDTDEVSYLREVPRIGLYSPWHGNMDEGWTRYVLDTFGVTYTTVRNEMLRAGQLRDFIDVLVIPHSSARQLDAGRSPGSVPDQYTRGLAPEGAIAIEEFVRSGGKLVLFGAACQWAVDLFRIPVTNVTRGDEAEGFSCPGSVLRAIPEPGSVFTADLPASMACFFSSGCAGWREMTDKEKKEADLDGDEREIATLLRFAPTRLLLSGWIATPEALEGHPAWIRVQHGEGSVHLFGFRPQYRAWSQGTFHLIFRAMLF